VGAAGTGRGMSYRRADLVAVVCNGRVYDADGQAGEPCGTALVAREGPLRGSGESLAELEARARAGGWKLGPVRPDGTRDVMCPDCGRPDPATARLCRELDRWLR